MPEFSPDALILLEQINGILFWLALGALCIDAYFVLFHNGVPNIRTAPAIRRRVIGLIRDDIAARGLAGCTVIDVGSGNGLLTREMARALPQARVVGIEIAGQSVLWSNWMKQRAGLGNLEYVHQDCLRYDFAGADAVVVFLIPALLGRLSRKLAAEARPGTLIISNKFPLGGGWEPVEVIKVKTLYLHQGRVHVYRKH